MSPRPESASSFRRGSSAVAWVGFLCWLTAAILLYLATAGCSARYSIPIAAGADIATTEVALNRYEMQEANPVLQSTAARVSWKVGLTVALVWLSEEMDRQGRHGTARAVQWIASGLWAGAAAWNVHQMSVTQRREP